MRDTAPKVAQEQQSSIQEEIIPPSIHCNHCFNIGFFYGKYRCSCFGCLRRDNQKTKCSIFRIEHFIKQLQKGGEWNGIFIDKITQKYMITDEVKVPNHVLHA